MHPHSSVPYRAPRSLRYVHRTFVCAAIGMGFFLGCTLKEEPPPRLPEPATRSVSVPIFRGTTLYELRLAVRKQFGDGPFAPGTTLDELPNADSVTGVEELSEETVKPFKVARLDDARSPLIAHQAKSGAVRIMQLGPEGDDKLSLVAGRVSGKDDVPNDKVFRVEERWLRRLVEWDSCTRAVAGDTAAAHACGVEGCPIIMTQQRFIHPTGELETLLFTISSDVDTDTVAKHDHEHVKKAKHCTATTDEAGSCKLDCVQTPK